MNQPLVSVVVPVYNAEQYIEKCIKSIQTQTYSHLDIVIINDGSVDGSPRICARISDADKRVRLIHQANQGVVKARKAGVAAAKGDFICWVDADDWIEPEYIAQFVKLQEESDADMVAVSHYHDIGKDSRVVKNGVQSGIYQVGDLAEVMLYTGEFYEYGVAPHLYTKLIRTNILKETQAAVPDNIIAGDDAAVVYPSLLRAKKVCVSDLSGYHYVQNPGSVTKVSYTDEAGRVSTLIEFLQEQFEKMGMTEVTKHQLYVYENYLLALRQIECFDEGGSEKILSPFGGFDESDRIVIYGAGVLGQRIYRYLKMKKMTEIVDWLDKNYETYQKNGFVVNGPDKLRELEGTYDYIVIANITEKVAMSIRRFLLKEGVEPEKIRWFIKEFRAV